MLSQQKPECHVGQLDVMSLCDMFCNWRQMSNHRVIKSLLKKQVIQRDISCTFDEWFYVLDPTCHEIKSAWQVTQIQLGFYVNM